MRFLSVFTGLTLALSPLLVVACGSSSSGSPNDAVPAGDGGNGGAKDAGNTSPGTDAGGGGIDAGPQPGYGAFTPDIGQLRTHGGPVVKAPKIVTIVWTQDPNYKTYETLGDDIGSSPYWTTTVSEYGVGGGTNGGHVEIAGAVPASFDDGPNNDEIDAFIVKGVTGAPGNGWPVADDNTIYMLYLPEATALLNNKADDCPNNSGYHTETTVGANMHVLYGVVASKCHDASQNVLEAATETATHEIAEAATDPHTNTDTAWTGFDTMHYAWELFQQRQDENGDACEFYEDVYYNDPTVGGFVQRLWSNASAKAGHNPCVPVPIEPYFNVTPLAQETIMPTGTTGITRTTKGYRIAVGASKTFDVGFYSDAKTEDWTVDVVAGDGFTTPTTPHATVKIDTPTGNNGTKAKITVNVTSAPAKGNQILVTMISARKTGPAHYFPILIGAY
jgi:hypothetical protein